MKYYNIVLTVFALFCVSLSGDGSQKVKIPKTGSLEYYRFIAGMYEVVSVQTDPITLEVTLKMRDESRGIFLNITQTQMFKNQFGLATKVKVETAELPHLVPDEKKIHLRFIGFDKWGLKVFSFDAYHYIGVPKEEKKPEKKEKPPVLNPGPMITTTRAMRGIFYIYPPILSSQT